MSRAGEHEEACVLRLVHHHPGRLRLRSPAFVDGDAAAARARDALLGSGAVLDVAHDERTGSLLIAYEPGRIAPDALAACAAEATGLRFVPGVPPCPERSHGARLIDACRDLNAATRELTGSRLELRLAVPAALAGISALTFFIDKGGRLPRWDSLAYWSITFFAMLHGREISAHPPAAGGEQAPR